jgi:RNA polymerase sigma-70 factor (ECF subfamily)
MIPSAAPEGRVSDLQTVFREALDGAEMGPIVGEGGTGELGGRLAALHARGRAAFPGVELGEEAFVRHLARSAAGGSEGPVALETLAIEDLYLARACVEGVAGAVAAFEARCLGPMRAALATFGKIASEREDIEQLVRMTVLVGRPGVEPKIANYLGRGPLGRWVGIVAHRIALATVRSSGGAGVLGREAGSGDALDFRDPGIALIKEQYRPVFQSALEEAMAKLEGRPRLLLRLNLVDGVSTVSLAKMFGVTQPTASRWLSQAREDVAKELRRILAARLALTTLEIESLAGLVISQLDLNLSLLLATSS